MAGYRVEEFFPRCWWPSSLWASWSSPSLANLAFAAYFAPQFVCEPALGFWLPAKGIHATHYGLTRRRRAAIPCSNLHNICGLRSSS